jgi:hypothetical protein
VNTINLQATTKRRKMKFNEEKVKNIEPGTMAQASNPSYLAEIERSWFEA